VPFLNHWLTPHISDPWSLPTSLSVVYLESCTNRSGPTCSKPRPPTSVLGPNLRLWSFRTGYETQWWPDFQPVYGFCIWRTTKLLLGSTRKAQKNKLRIKPPTFCRNNITSIITRQFDCLMSKGMAVLSREDTTPQTLADAHCSSAVHERWLYRRTQDLALSEFYTWQNSVTGQEPPKGYRSICNVPAQETAKHLTKFGWHRWATSVQWQSQVTKPVEICCGCPKLANRSQPLVGRSLPFARTRGGDNTV